MNKKFHKRLKSKISRDVIRRAANHFGKSEPLIYKVIVGDVENLEILDWCISTAKTDKEQKEILRKEIIKKAETLC